MAFVQIDELTMMSSLIHDWGLHGTLHESATLGSGQGFTRAPEAPKAPEVDATAFDFPPDDIDS